MTNNRPWRDLIDIPEDKDWPDWEKRFAATSGEVKVVDPAKATAAPPPEEKAFYSVYNQPKKSHGIGMVPKKPKL